MLYNKYFSKAGSDLDTHHVINTSPLPIRLNILPTPPINNNTISWNFISILCILIVVLFIIVRANFILWRLVILGLV